MRLLDFALRELERGHQQWPSHKKALAIVLTVALVLVSFISAYVLAVQGFPVD